MLFVIDIGNSHTVTGLYRDDQLIGQWRIKSDRASTGDEIAIQHMALFSLAAIDPREISAIVIASVVPTLETAWLSCCRNYFCRDTSVRILTVSDLSVAHLIQVRLPNPSEVGADRLVNAIAAYEKFHAPLIVIDFGTAITFDCVTSQREYIGGVILPGIAISLDALAQKTAKLPLIDIADPPEKIIGTSTVNAMKSGILHGYGGMIDGLVAGIKNEMSPDHHLEVIATGGMAKLIAPYSHSIDHIDPMLTLSGLKIIHDQTPCP